MDIVINQNLTITDPELKKITGEIRKASINVINNTFKIAVLMAKVNDDELYLKDGFSDIYAYAKTAFGIEKTSTFNLIRVGSKYVTKIYHGSVPAYETILNHDDKDFSISQVFKMLPLGIDKAIELTDDKVITPDMSCRAIEKVVKEYNEPEPIGDPGGSDPEPIEDNEDPEPEPEPTEDFIGQVPFKDLPEDIQNYFLNLFDVSSWDNIREIDIV